MQLSSIRSISCSFSVGIIVGNPCNYIKYVLYSKFWLEWSSNGDFNFNFLVQYCQVIICGFKDEIISIYLKNTSSFSDYRS